jgi:hypothetical protein
MVVNALHLPSPADRLLQFVVEHEPCGQDAEVGRIDREDDSADIVLSCQGCGATLAVPVTVTDARAFLDERNGYYSDDDVRRAQANVRKH